MVDVARVALEHRVGLVPPVPTEVAVEQVDHRPQVATLLDVDLEQVAEVVEARGGRPEVALLLDRRRLGVTLDDDQPAEVGPELAGHLLPNRLALQVTEADRAIRLRLGEEHTPAVVGHLDVAEVGPAVLADVDRRAEVDLAVLEADRTHRRPPVGESGLPVLEGSLEPAVGGEVDVVGDSFAVVDGRHRVLLVLAGSVRFGRGRRSPGSRCRSSGAPPPGRWRSGG